jgi:hypothetical protein
MYVPYDLIMNNCILPTECICVFRMIATINSDYFLKQDLPIDCCCGDELYFPYGTDWIFKYYFDDLRLQTVSTSNRTP